MTKTFLVDQKTFHSEATLSHTAELHDEVYFFSNLKNKIMRKLFRAN